MRPVPALLVQPQPNAGDALRVLRNRAEAAAMVLVAAQQQHGHFNGWQPLVEVESARSRAAQSAEPPLEALDGAGQRVKQHLHGNQRLRDLALVDEAVRHARAAALVSRIAQCTEAVARSEEHTSELQSP